MSLILKPGDAPPDIIPFCGICDQPAERFKFDLIEGTADTIGIHAQCCDRTSSTRIGLKTYLQMRATGAKIYVIVRKGSQAGLRNQKTKLRSISH